MLRKETRENYLKLIYNLQINDEKAINSEIARILDVSRPTVTIAVRKLREEGYLIHYSSDGALLTEKGLQEAMAVMERYQFFVKLLISLGINAQTAREDACHLEHSISEESFRALQNFFEDSQTVKCQNSKKKTELT